LRQRLATAWTRWHSWRAERDTVTREAQAVRIQLARLRATAGRPRLPAGARHSVPALAARLAVLKSRLATLTRARGPEDLLLRTVRQIGVAKALALLPKTATAVILGLRIGVRAVLSMARDR
jgi:hypothetical protein